MKRKLSFILAVSFIIMSLSACGKTVTKDAKEVQMDLDVKKEDIANMKALSFEELASRTDTSSTENLVYQYVSDSVTVDTSELITVDTSEESTEKQSIDRLIDSINTALITGVVPDGVDAGILNYMLLKFANTPFKWQHKSTEIRGMDAQTRMYFVDVTYKTVDDDYKDILPDSVIVRGSDQEDTLEMKRYTDYLTWLESGEACVDDSGSETKWSQQVREEWESASSMNTLIFGALEENDDVAMDGYTEDMESNDSEEPVDIYDAFYDNVVLANGEEAYVFNYTFEDRWGSIEELRAMQDGITLIERVVKSVAKNPYYDSILNTFVGTTPNIGTNTYGGLTEVAANHGAEITFRFLLKTTYNIGLTENLKVQSMYVHSYTLDNKQALLDKYTTETITNGAVLQPYIETLIKSYNKCIDESNHTGLCNLLETYEKYDTYIENQGTYSYITSGGFSVEPIGRKGDEIACIVTQQLKERAKGTYMTMPTYINEYLVKVKLCKDDKVRIVTITLLNSNLIGEPLSLIRNVTGISDKISFSEGKFTTANQAAIEDAICQFETLMLKSNGTVSAEVYDIVDMGISTTEKSNLEKYFAAIKDNEVNKAYVWLTGFESKTNIYAKLLIREVFLGNGGNYETEGSISLVYRNNAWRIVSYTRNYAVEINRNKLSTKNCFLDIDLSREADKQVLKYSQIKEIQGSVGGLEQEQNPDVTTDSWDDEKYTGTTTAAPMTDENGNVLTDENGNTMTAPTTVETIGEETTTASEVTEVTSETTVPVIEVEEITSVVSDVVPVETTTEDIFGDLF